MTATLYRVDVYRDDRWWMIRVPQLDGHVDADGARLAGEAITQARRFADIIREATDFICVVTDSAPSAVELDIHTSIGGEDYVAQASDVIELKKRAHTLEREALEKSRHVARQLASQGVPVRDIGDILGVTYQRASQLAAEAV